MDDLQSETQTDLFESHELYKDASTGSRFLNFIIDNILMNYGLSLGTGYVVGYLITILAPDWAYRISVEETNTDLLLLSYCLVLFNHIVYYTLCEFAFKGYTLGKLITGTKAIRNDGTPLRLKDALLRSLSRLVPFEPFSALGNPCNPWHDSWTKTRVVKSR